MLQKRKRGGHNEEEGNRSDRYIRLRNVLNSIFMLGALVGVCVYVWGNATVGTIIILVAMAFKMVECVYRFMK